MKLGLLVNEGPYQHQAADTAYQFATAAIEKGHEIFRVFFYHDGVNNGTRLTTPPQDDRQASSAAGPSLPRRTTWTSWCASRRPSGGASATRTSRNATARMPTTSRRVRISGLGQLVEAAIECDRLVTFGD